MRRHNLRDRISKLYGLVYNNNHITGVFDQCFAFGNRDNQHPFGVFNLDIYTKLNSEHLKSKFEPKHIDF